MYLDPLKDTQNNSSWPKSYWDPLLTMAWKKTVSVGVGQGSNKTFCDVGWKGAEQDEKIEVIEKEGGDNQ